MAKTIMIQGTMSNVGKSLMVAALCRIFKQDGYSVAPFKSQNMALNSYITKEGLEMGRATVMQCECAGIDPSVLMNPILLKPSSDTGSQVIVNGEVVSNMTAVEYFSYKKKLLPVIKKAFDELEQEYDIIVIEGAGSPAEINLKQQDIVNMGMAELVDAPVLLVGDIDRGGVFAQLYGTILLLEEKEIKRVKGLIINKFRGDKAILQPGLTMLEEKCQKSILGVIPFVNVDIEEEDSLSERFEYKKEKKEIDIAVIKFPRISNFTDFLVLEARKDISVRYVSKVSELSDPDMIILPGTKSTMSDLLWMRQNGLEASIIKKSSDTIIFGICGGYQMMGEYLYDNLGIEGITELRGMELLCGTTTFKNIKTRTRVSGEFKEVKGRLKELSNVKFTGYEIHMGETTTHAPIGIISSQNGMTKIDGAQNGNYYGTYVHGIFDEEAVVKALITALRKNKGLPIDNIDSFDFSRYKEKQYDLLAKTARENIDMKEIYKIIFGRSI